VSLKTKASVPDLLDSIFEKNPVSYTYLQKLSPSWAWNEGTINE